MDNRNMARTKLTKTALLELDQGVWIASNTFKKDWWPKYVAKVSPLRVRETQWIEIRKAGVDRRGFWIFKRKSELNRWIAEGRLESQN